MNATGIIRALNEPVGLSAELGRLLTFVAGGASYGVCPSHVRAVLGVPTITPTPHLPIHVRGVAHVHGRVIPIIDLRLKLGLVAAFDAQTRVLIVHAEVSPTGGATTFGVLVDAVGGDHALVPALDAGMMAAFEGRAITDERLRLAAGDGLIIPPFMIDQILFGDPP